MTSFAYTCALKKDGREAAFFNSSDELQVIAVEKTLETKLINLRSPQSKSQSQWDVSVNVYSDEGKLHVLHNGDSLTLRSSNKRIYPPRSSTGSTKGHLLSDFSKDRLHCFPPQNERDQPFTHTTIAKRKLRKTDLEYLSDTRKLIRTKPEGK